VVVHQELGTLTGPGHGVPGISTGGAGLGGCEGVRLGVGLAVGEGVGFGEAVAVGEAEGGASAAPFRVAAAAETRENTSGRRYQHRQSRTCDGMKQILLHTISGLLEPAIAGILTRVASGAAVEG